MNVIGLTSALVVFLGVWSGHVLVRKIEFQVDRLWLPGVVLMLISLSLGWCSLLAPVRVWSAVLGISCVLVYWDVLELYRQQKRVKKGHAPANPKNPRHARIIKNFPSATMDNPYRVNAGD